MKIFVEDSGGMCCSVDPYPVTQRHIPEHLYPQQHRHENLTPRNMFGVFVHVFCR